MSAEARIYLALRRAYARAGYTEETATPLAWIETLHRTRAPGAETAERLVRSYLRARFAGESIGETGREGMKQDLAEAKQALQASRRRAA